MLKKQRKGNVEKIMFKKFRQHKSQLQWHVLPEWYKRRMIWLSYLCAICFPFGVPCMLIKFQFTGNTVLNWKYIISTIVVGLGIITKSLLQMSLSCLLELSFNSSLNSSLNFKVIWSFITAFRSFLEAALTILPGIHD